MLYAAIDIHKHAFQAAVLDPENGVVVEERFAADRESLARWAEPWRGRVTAVAIEATISVLRMANLNVGSFQASTKFFSPMKRPSRATVTSVRLYQMPSTSGNPNSART